MSVPRELVERGYMAMRCTACGAELLSDDWSDAQVAMWRHHLASHRDVVDLTWGLDLSDAGELPHHTERAPLSPEQTAQLAAYDALIGALA